MKVFSDLIKSLKWKMDENGNEQKRVHKKKYLRSALVYGYKFRNTGRSRTK